MLLQLAYYSRSLVHADETTLLSVLREVLKRSRPNNERDGLTGYLLFDRTWFVQILEGDPETVRETMKRIATDPRHRDITIISQRDVRARAFPQWSMGGTARTHDNEEIFLEHGVGTVFDPRTLTVPTIVSLAMELQDAARARKLRAASPSAGVGRS